MGCGYDLICKTCRKSFYVGYGSYGTWLVAPTLAEWQKDVEAHPDYLNLKKNQCVRRVLTEHAGHEIYPANWDYHDAHRGALTGQFGPMGADVTVIPDYSEYEHVDLYSDDYDRDLNDFAQSRDV